MRKPFLKTKKDYNRKKQAKQNRFWALNKVEKEAKIQEKLSKKKKFLKFKLKKENLPNENEIEIN